MKKFLLGLCLLALSTGIAVAQSSYSELSVQTEYITEVKSSRDALFINAQTWANANTTERNVSVETSDKGTGTLILKVSSKLPRKEGINDYSVINVQMNVKIDCRDGKYRVTYSNFTSTVQPDRTIDVQYLGTSSLQSMIEELEAVEKLATGFGKEVYWGYDKIVAAKHKYLEQNKRYKDEIAALDANSKKGKKEIKWNNRWIEENNVYINYLDYILKGFESAITDFQTSISKAMNVSDDF